ncbi:MAG TPA: type II secretion system F family protein [Planctomycetota bacterium]|nr:type II secretion system F family protein [Planctomycetota bacterium]
MPTFKITASDKAGRKVNRTVEAPSQGEAVAVLRREGYTALDIHEERGGASGAAKTRKGPSPRVSGSDLAIFTRQFATMIGAGIAVLECLDVLTQQASDPGFRFCLETVVEDIRGGTDLSTAMSRHPKVFSHIYVNMVKAGEASGQLEAILVRLAEYMEATVKLKREIVSAMTYPVISLVMIFGVTAFLMIFIIPKFEEIFKSLNVDLPIPTRVVLITSKIMVSYWWAVLIGLALLITGIVLFKRTETGGLLVDKLTLKIPVFGPLFQKVALSRFARTFSTLIKSGVPILGALEIVASTSGNRVIEATVSSCKDSIRAGEPLSKPLSQSPVFPPMVVRMISIGEKSGALEQLLEKISQFYDEQVSAAVEGLTAMIEPIMIAIMGLVVGGIVISVFLPIVKIQQMLSKK